MILIDGKKEAAKLREELKQEVLGLKNNFKKVPGLTVILIGEMAPSQIYVRNKEKSAREVGLKSGVNVPLWPCEHFYLLTKPIDGVSGNLSLIHI